MLADRDPGVSAYRAWASLAFFIVAYLAFDPIEAAIHRPIADALGLHMIRSGMMAPLPYGMLMIVRLGLDAIAVLALLKIQRRRWFAFPIAGPAMLRMTLLGIATGLVVMIGAIGSIVMLGDASVAASGQSPVAAAWHGGTWFVFDFLGAMGEELAGRVAVLLVAQPLIGRRGAILASGILFAGIHVGNPGVSAIWLLRLFFQGLLLAYAVYRTGSFWWSTGYHAGWNWASAPLFGAAGSGYLDAGHLFDFAPSGSVLVTGGDVGPEGSVFAYAAMLVALVLLVVSTSRPAFSRAPRRPIPGASKPGWW